MKIEEDLIREYGRKGISFAYKNFFFGFMLGYISGCGLGNHYDDIMYGLLHSNSVRSAIPDNPENHLEDLRLIAIASGSDYVTRWQDFKRLFIEDKYAC